MKQRSLIYMDDNPAPPVVVAETYQKYFVSPSCDTSTETRYLHRLSDDSATNLRYRIAEKTDIGTFSSEKANLSVDNGLQLPSNLEMEFKRSEDILKMHVDCEDEESPLYQREVLSRSIAFVKNHARWLAKECRQEMDTPEILPGPDGSIDVHWRQSSYELLVNIPTDMHNRATYYGDNYRSSVIKGTFDPTTINKGFLQLWTK